VQHLCDFTGHILHPKTLCDVQFALFVWSESVGVSGKCRFFWFVKRVSRITRNNVTCTVIVNYCPTQKKEKHLCDFTGHNVTSSIPKPCSM